MDIATLMTNAQDAMTVRRVFGDPILQDGITIVPVARVRGGGGGGGGAGPDGTGEGSGGGFGLRADPVGVVLVRGDDVTWQPTVDVTRLAVGGQVVAVVALLTIRSIVRARARRASA